MTTVPKLATYDQRVIKSPARVTRLTGACLIGALVFTGCQSTALVAPNKQALTPTAAKTVLAEALQTQRRQSFSYHSTLEISNQQQIDALESSDLVATDDVDRHCEDTHDQAYAALLAQSEAQNKDILANDYAVARAAIKQSYQECAAAYQAWEDQRYADDYAEYTRDQSQDAAINDQVDQAADREVLTQSMNDTITLSETRRSNAAPIKPSATISTDSDAEYQALFDDYEQKVRAIDVKKAKLLDAYLLKPLSLNAQGVYQPRAGKFTMLASAQYQTRNHHTSINQPIYVDFKTGNLYLWADNLALMNSEMLDDKLGLAWQNKWLKIALNDGSLPKGFGRTLIQSHFAAADHVYQQAPVTQFDALAPSTLSALTPKLPEPQLNAMRHSAQIIRRTQSFESYEQSYHDYWRMVYTSITEQYPELVNERRAAANVANFDQTSLTSKALVQQGLMMIKQALDTQEAITDTATSSIETNSTESDSIETNSIETRAPIQTLYGLNPRGQLQWQHLRTQIPSSATDTLSPNMILDALQQYTPIRRQDVAFPNLPRDRQVPNADNSVDLRDYSRELMEYYRAGNGTAMGKMLMSVLPAMPTMAE